MYTSTDEYFGKLNEKKHVRATGRYASGSLSDPTGGSMSFIGIGKSLAAAGRRE